MLARFEFRPLSSAITLGMLALLIWLGTWQLSRADEKRETLRAFDQTQRVVAWRNVSEPPPRYTQVSLSGRYDEAHQVLLDGVRRHGQAGVEVLTPLRLDNGGHCHGESRVDAVGRFTQRATYAAGTRVKRDGDGPRT